MRYGYAEVFRLIIFTVLLVAIYLKNGTHLGENKILLDHKNYEN